MDWGAGAAARMTGLALDRKGRPLPQLLAADAVRCALVVDLAVAGRLARGTDHIDLDTTATGFPPADALLAAAEVEPDRDLADWFGDRRLGLDLFVDALVDLDRWRPHRGHFGGTRYRVQDPDRLARDLRTESLEHTGTPSPVDAAVLALGRTAHLVGRHRRLGYGVDAPEVPADLLTFAGPHAWVVTDGVEFLRARRSLYRFGDLVLD